MPTKTGELVAKAAKGDKNALAELYTTNFKSAFFPACGLLGNKQDALKAVINSFAKAFKNLSKLPKPDEFEDWIKQIAVKHCIDVIKKKKGTPLSAEKPGICRVEIESSFEFLPIDVLNAKELTSETIKAVNSMPDTQRICVYLCYYNGYSASAAAKLISCTEDDVKWHLLAAREQIKNAVDTKTGNPTELSKMNGTSILSLVMELAKKELTVNSDTVKKSFFLACEKSGLFGEKKAPVAAAPVNPEPAYAPMPQYQQPVYEPSYPPVYNAPVQPEEPVPQKKKKSSAPIIVAVIILLLLIAAGLAYWFVAKDNPDLPLPFAPEETTSAVGSGALNEDMIIGSMNTITRPGDGITSAVDSETLNAGMTIGVIGAITRQEDGTASAPVTTTSPVTTTKPQTEPSTAAKADGYMAAYNNYLKNYNGGVYEKSYRFGFGYFNNDDIPELFIGEAYFRPASIKVLTYVDGNVVELCDYGYYGAIHYVERESMVVLGDVNRGYESGSIRKINDDGTEEVLFRHLDNAASVVDESDEVFYEINGERVSEEEYHKAIEENMSMDTVSFCEGIPMTTENIDKYCS